MPQFLTTSGTSHHIEEIIIRAKAELVLITPYLKLNRILFERLTEANDRGVTIILVYGKSELHPSEKKQLDALDKLQLYYLENLHAKCYHNETTLIVSSMNLYDFSERNNREMGILLTGHNDRECFADALAEARSIVAAAQRITPARHQKQPAPKLAATPKKEFNHALHVRKLHELLQSADYAQKFEYKEVPRDWGGGIGASITAQDFPRKGIHFKFDSTVRFDFSDRNDYQRAKTTQRTKIDQALTDYRCYWNQDVIQVYSAKNYDMTDEQESAAYHLFAIQQVVELLLMPAS